MSSMIMLALCMSYAHTMIMALSWTSYAHTYHVWPLSWSLIELLGQLKKSVYSKWRPSLQAWPALSSQRGVESNPGPVSNLLMPEFWCSIGYFELDTQVPIVLSHHALALFTWWTPSCKIGFNSRLVRFSKFRPRGTTQWLMAMLTQVVVTDSA